MEYNEICGKRQLEFIKQFDYIREAGTDGEEKAALEIQRELKSFGVDSRLEEFEIDTWRILKAEFTVTEPFEKTYTVAGYGRCGSTPAEGSRPRSCTRKTAMILIFPRQKERSSW